MSDLVERLHDLYCPDDADQRTANEAAARIEELERALENLCIHVGMGWETDGVLETARAVLEKGRAGTPARVHDKGKGKFIPYEED
jgi:plasmid stabilization system protein ParE